jgi:hypothetical protein
VEIDGIVQDAVYPSMWRIRYVDGSVSDLVNFTRAKDACGSDVRVYGTAPVRVREVDAVRPWRQAEDVEAVFPVLERPVASATDAVLSDWEPTATTIDPNFPEMPAFLRRV